MKIGNALVIGGRGFIGEHLVSELLKYGGDVSVFDKDSSEPIETAVSRASRVAFLAPPGTGLLPRVLAAVSKHAVPTFLYASTALLYEGGKEARKETDPLLPMTEYAKKKGEEEALVRGFMEGHPDANVIVARLGNVYGDKKNKGVIGLAFDQLSGNGGGKEIVVAGDGMQARDFVFVDDVARALSGLLANNTKAGVVNITTGSAITVLQAIRYIEEMAQKKIAYRFGPAVTEPHSLVGDTTKLRTLLAWAPSTTLQDGLHKTYGRYMINTEKRTA